MSLGNSRKLDNIKASNANTKYEYLTVTTGKSFTFNFGSVLMNSLGNVIDLGRCPAQTNHVSILNLFEIAATPTPGIP